MLLIYQMNSQEPGPWKISTEAEDTLRASYKKDGFEVRLLIAGRKFMQRQAIRLMRAKESGEYDEQIVRVIARNSGKTPVHMDFAKIVIESAGKTSRPMDAALYQKQVYAKGRLDFNFYFGQKHLRQFGLTMPDYLQGQEEDTASPAEKQKRLLELTKQSPWAPPEIQPGEVHGAFMIFPRLEIQTDYVLRLDQIGSPLPPLKFQVKMIRRLSSEDEPEISMEVRKEIIEEKEWIKRMNQDFFAMHRQILRHDELAQAEAEKQKTAPESAVDK